MDDRRFDDLTRAFGRATSRRSVLKGILGSAVAALVGGTSAATAAAAPASTTCDMNACMHQAHELWKVCQSNCTPLCRHGFEQQECAACNLACGELKAISEHDCQTNNGCFTGTCCNGSCVDTRSDASNCGACGTACPAGTVCQNGSCSCGPGTTNCGGNCVDTSANSNHCGSCTTVCGTCKACVGGSCVDVACGASKVCCNDQCVAACPSGEMDPTTCTCACPPGQKLCGAGTCTDILTSAFNCGDCDVMCSGGQTCQNGTCACPSSQPDFCFGACVDFANDPYNCGGCSIQCGSTQICANGTCQNCPSGQTFCGGACVNAICQPNETFNAFSCSCQAMCAAGVTYCKDDPSNGYVCCTDGYCFNDEIAGHRCCPTGHYCINSAGTPTGCCGPYAVPTYPGGTSQGDSCDCMPAACVQDFQACPTCVVTDNLGNGYCA